MSTKSTVALENQLCFSLYRANLEIGRAYQPLFDELGITYPQYLVLNSLWEMDERTVGDIARRLTLESANITPLIKRLEAAGLVNRRRNPTDDRQVLVTLTKLGREMQQRCTLQDALTGATGLPASHLTALNTRLQELLRCIDEVKAAHEQ